MPGGYLVPTEQDEWEDYFANLESSRPAVRAVMDFAKTLDPDETPFTTTLGPGRSPWSPPDYCIMEKKEAVEPFMDWYTQANDIIEEVNPRDEYDEDEYWREIKMSPALIKLMQLAKKIGQFAYKEVPNPNYDEAACLKWKEENVKTWSKIEWGTSNLLPPLEEATIITPAGPRTLDEGKET